MARAKGRGADKQGRSDGEPAWSQWLWWMMESPAFMALSCDGKTALLFMTKRFNGRNNGKIIFGVRTGSRIRNPGQPDSDVKDYPVMSKTKMTGALGEIEALKLATVMRGSSFGQKKLAREWRLNWLPCGGSPATRDFMLLTIADCERIKADLKTKARSAGRTMKARTGPPAGQSAPSDSANIPVQVRPQTYDQFSQVRRQATSSNHPIGVQRGGQF